MSIAIQPAQPPTRRLTATARSTFTALPPSVLRISKPSHSEFLAHASVLARSTSPAVFGS